MSSESPAPVQTQPQWENGTKFFDSQHSKPIVPPGLEWLAGEKVVVLKDKVFQTSNGHTLFSVRRKSECCGPSLNLRLRDPHRRDVVSLRLDSGGGCCCGGGGESYLRVSAPSAHPIGFVIIVSSSTSLNVSIQMGNREPVFYAKMPVTTDADSSSIQILSIDGSHPVASITKEKEGDSSQVIFHFPMDMEATLKAVILAAFLYMTYCLQKVSSSYSSSDDGWAFAGGLYWAVGGDFDGGGGDYGGGGDGGDCGGGDGGGE
ncbi:phospholipid scramblase 1-like isoform X1 [Hyperolius riggenbachi]|uniref:phospholipid scramblase 1-like isoform X1 n=1 Tax=Hyperolius riggenbachi TaxID=752182 RepID=UPI0035A2EA73